MCPDLRHQRLTTRTPIGVCHSSAFLVPPTHHYHQTRRRNEPEGLHQALCRYASTGLHHPIAEIDVAGAHHLQGLGQPVPVPFTAVPARLKFRRHELSLNHGSNGGEPDYVPPVNRQTENLSDVGGAAQRCAR